MEKEDKTEELLEHARKRFDRCVEAESRNREAAIEDLKFSEGEQWPDAVRTEREKEGRPCLVLNRIPAFIKLVINDIRQSRPAIKCFGVDSQADPKTAEILNGLIKNIEQSSNAEIAYDWASEYAIRCGWGYFEIATKYVNEESFDQDLYIRRINNPFSVYLDPEHLEPDGSDSKYAFMVDYMNKEEYEHKYPDAKCGFEESQELGTEKEKWFLKDKVRIAKYWIVEEESATLSVMADGSTYIGERVDGSTKTRKITRKRVKQYITNGHEILEEYDWAGKYIPIIPVLGEEINIEGETVLGGLVRHLKDAQRQYNYWRSSSTERVALYSKAPYIGAKGQFKSPKWRMANQKNFPYIEYDMVEKNGVAASPPQRQAPPEVSSGMVNEIATSADEIKAISGIHDPSLGMQANEVSGVAINARQRQSGITNFHYMDNLARALRHAGRVIVDLIPRIYDSERIVRIIGMDGEERQVKINAPYVDEKQKEQFYDLKTGHYDVVVDVGPSYATQRQEAVQSMLEFTSNDPETKTLLGDLIAKNMDWPGADEVAKRLRMRLPADLIAEENPQIKAMLQQFQMEKQGMQEQAQQMMEYIKTLEGEMQSMGLQLQSKQQDFVVKMRELDRKTEKDDDDYALKATEMALKYNKDIPGDLVQ